MACITKRQGRYVLDCYDQHGKRYRKTLPEGTTKDNARKKLREIEEKIERRTFMHEKKTPLFSEVAKQWLDWKKPDVRITTWNWQETVIKTRFGTFDVIKIPQITTATVEKWFNEMRERGLKTLTIRHMTVILGQIMSYAVRHKMIDSNPVREAQKPRRKIDDDMKPQVLTTEQIKDFLAGIDDQKYHALFMTAVFTGARRGEIMGLKCSEVDFDKKQICINRTFNHGRIFPPKTKSSIRAIDCPPMLVNELRQWMLKSGGRDEDFLFSSDDGKSPLNEATVYNRFIAALKTAKCPKIRMHDLRHTYASLLLQQGENIKYIQTQLGHATPMMTLNVYSHLMKDENQEAAVRLEKAVFG